MVDGKHTAAGEGAVERVARPFAFHGVHDAALAVEIFRQGVG